MTITLYGIPNCDTVKKARTWLDQAQQTYTFHDFKKAGLDAATVELWLQQVSWEILVNRKGTTWRKLDEAVRHGVVDAASAKALMLEHTSVIKRPVLVLAESDQKTSPKSSQKSKQVMVGFDAAQYQSLFNPT
ncbi:MAG: hypothetical protein RL748_1435 [Pseudomonadota bacterium]|jgi:arsenate reductase